MMTSTATVSKPKVALHARPASRTCPGCFNPIAADAKRCARCGRSISGTQKALKAVTSRDQCPVCNTARVLRPFHFGVQVSGQVNSTNEFETTACTMCLSRFEGIMGAGKNLLRGALAAAGVGGFTLLMWWSEPEATFLYLTLGLALTGLGIFLGVMARAKHQTGIRTIVGKLPKVIELQSRGSLRFYLSSATPRPV